jgi:UDP-N-acetylglucosamine 4,6-dehydratase
MLGGEVFVLKMHALTVGDLIGAVVELAASRLGKPPSSVEVRTIGHRIGERMHELLLNDTECRGALEDDEMYIIPPHPELWGTLPDPYASSTLKKVAAQVVSSESAKRMSREDFKKALISEGIADQLGAEF